MKKLPISKSVFQEIRNEDLCYVDKTSFVRQLLDDHSKYWFLARPRRFGKTLFLDTLRAAFAGEEKLFRGLFLENNWDWDIKYPVVNISFASGTIESKEELKQTLREILDVKAEQYDVIFEKETLSGRFEELIRKLFEKYKSGVVILVDEYDKPLLDNITKEAADDIREGLTSFYSVLKDADRYIKFVFLTGVSKFSKTSIFSKLNNLTDISLDPDYGNICGYTQEDLETVFKEYLKGLNLQEIREWYDGYNFLGDNLYNPYDVLLYLDNKVFKSYWFETGTPSFLLEVFKKKQYFLPNLYNIELSDSQMGEFDINHIELDALLYQTGYLTIKKMHILGDDIYYSLFFPNKEVRKGLNDYLLRMFFANGADAANKTKLSQQIYKALYSNTPKLLEKAFFSFFAQIPYAWYIKNNIANYEGYYCSVFYAFFVALGLEIIPEDITNKGRIDFTILMDKTIFIFEIKLKSNPGNALEQIKKKKYHEKYIAEDKKIFLIGIEFDEGKKNLSMFETRTIDQF